MSLGSDSKSDHIVMERSEVQKRFASHVQQKVLRAKVVVVGNATTGKTTLLRLFNGENFDAKHYKMTARTEIIVSKRLPVSESTQVEFIFYDSGGAQIFNFTQEQSQYVSRSISDSRKRAPDTMTLSFFSGWQHELTFRTPLNSCMHSSLLDASLFPLLLFVFLHHFVSPPPTPPPTHPYTRTPLVFSPTVVRRKFCGTRLRRVR